MKGLRKVRELLGKITVDPFQELAAVGVRVAADGPAQLAACGVAVFRAYAGLPFKEARGSRP